MTTRIILCVDESSSMASDYARTISARNEIIEEQKNVQIDGETTSPKFSYYTFSWSLSSPQEFESIKDVDVDSLKYSPNGMTALLDAVGLIGTKYMNEENVILFINTDGEENCSKEFTTESLKKLLITLQNEKNWTIHYIGANVDAWNISQNLGIQNFTQSTTTTPLHPGLVRETSMNMSHYRSLNSSRVQSAPTIRRTPNEEPQHLVFQNNQTNESQPF
tara:strand:+ start:3182 stop:3841 length:660 start_codon:yes stop_codon:yes gene_type:complete